jgi:hypothetical protein
VSFLVGSQPAAAIAATVCSGVPDIFYESVPPDVDGFAVLEVTLVKFPARNGPMYSLGIAKIERVIQGSVGNEFISIIVQETCFMQIQIGTRGIVIGTIESDGHGEFSLISIPKRELEWRVKMRRRP